MSQRIHECGLWVLGAANFFCPQFAEKNLYNFWMERCLIWDGSIGKKHIQYFDAKVLLVAEMEINKLFAF
jgi:hypothetical protein